MAIFQRGEPKDSEGTMFHRISTQHHSSASIQCHGRERKYRAIHALQTREAESAIEQ
jgi:hypothetical protein